jgi:hypothetical protein
MINRFRGRTPNPASKKGDELPRRPEAVEKVGIGPADSPELGLKRLRMGVFDVKPGTRIGNERVFQHAGVF